MPFPMIIQVAPNAKEPENYIVPHTVEDDALVKLIMQDLNNRYPDHKVATGVENWEATCLFWDSGGAISMGWKANTDGPIGFWPHQYESFLFTLNKALSKVRTLGDTRYCKIGTAYSMLCVREETVQKARQYVLDNREALAAECERCLDDWEDALKKLQGSPVILLPKPVDPSTVN